MSKKSFTGGLDALLTPSSEEERKERKVKPENKNTKARHTVARDEGVKNSTHENKDNDDFEDRYTIFLKNSTLKKLQALAWWERRKIKEVANTALEEYFASRGAKLVKQALNEFTKAKG